MELLLLLPELNLKDVNIGQKGRASIITCVFGGVLQSEVCDILKIVFNCFYRLVIINVTQVRCLNCSSVSKKQDPFLDLSLDIPDKYLPKHLSSRRSKEPQEQDSPACNIFGKLNLVEFSLVTLRWNFVPFVSVFQIVCLVLSRSKS